MAEPFLTTLGITAAQTAANIGTNYAGATTSVKKSKQLQDYAFSKNLEMWNRQNEYNLPINQMQRLSDAGLNPNMMYGTGQGANTAKEMPKYNAPTAQFNYEPVNIAQTLSAFQDVKVKQAQIDNIKAQTETRRLENNLRSGVLQDAIDKWRSEARSARERATLDTLSRMVEVQFQGMYGGLAGDSTTELLGGTMKRLGELEMTQEGARRTKSEADVKEIEAGIYQWIEQKYGKKDAAALSKILMLLINKL